MDVASILGNLIGRTYPVFFISICLENPTLRTFFKVALSCSHRQENLTCWYVCRVSASRMYVASNLGRTAVVRTRSSLSRFCLGAPTIRTYYTIGLLSAPRQEKCHLLNICRFSACSMHVASNLGSMYHVSLSIFVWSLRLPNRRSGLKSKQLIRPNAINPQRLLFVLTISWSKCRESVLSVWAPDVLSVLLDYVIYMRIFSKPMF